MNYKINDVVIELNEKLGRIYSLLDEKGLDALLLKKVSSFAWATCGSDSHINTAQSEGVASLLITRQARYLITNTIEAGRLEAEERLTDQGWKFEVVPWYEDSTQLAGLVNGMKLGADHSRAGALDLNTELAWMRSQLSQSEILRFRILADRCADAIREAVEAARPGMSEYQLAGLLARASESRGVEPIVNLIGTDDRIFSFRHPLPTDRKLDKYAMFVLCGRKWGLVCSLTRLVHFGPIPSDLLNRHAAVARMDAKMILATRPGSTIGDVFQTAQDAYEDAGYPDEWQNHHQGGLAGYEPREITAVPNSDLPVKVGQIYAWNPSIRGTKSEDSILVGAQENEILTSMPDWPVIEVVESGIPLKRPAILLKT
jgi:antitoxin VapB